MPLSPPAPCALCQCGYSLRWAPVGGPRLWHSLRSMSQLQKRKPARMMLSDRLSQQTTGEAGKHHGSGAFGGVNRTTVPDGFGDQRRQPRTPRSLIRSKDRIPTTVRPSTFATIKQERKKLDLPGAFGAMNRTKVPESVKVRIAHPPAPTGPPRRTTSPKSMKGERDKPKRREGNYHALKMQQSLDTLSYHNRMKVKDKIKEIDSFEQFELLDLVRGAIGRRALGGQEEITPTPIQRLAIPAILAPSRSKFRQNSQVDTFLLAAETGSGKTLAYLLPILDDIKRTEEVEKLQEEKNRAATQKRMEEDPTFVEAPALDDRVHHTSGRPRAIILLPTAELVTQVSALIRQLAFDIKVRSDGISSSFAPRVIKRKVYSEEGIDLLVATPHLLESMSCADPHILNQVRHLVIDEADSLLDRSFSKAVDPIIEKCTPSLEKLIFCSATIPTSIDKHLDKKYPDMTRLVTPNLHAIPRRVQLSVIDIEKDPYRGNRDIACADVIYGIGKSAHEPSPTEPPEFSTKRIMVFVNEREKTVELADYLKSKGIDAVAMHRDTEAERRSDLLKAFTVRPPHQRGAQDMTPPEHLESLQPVDTPTRLGKPMLSNTKVLVTTDIASRGIDTLAVRNVILYDVPHSTIDFIHRLGRTGRMKMRGRGVVLVGRQDRRDVVKEVKDGMFRGQALI